MKKYLMHMFAAAAFWAALHPLRASAAADEVQVDETGAVSIVSEHAAKDEISSLQFGLSVDSADAATVTFQFNTSRAKVQDYRYDAEKKVLNVYLAGTEALFADGADTLSIGKLVVLDAAGQDAGAIVNLVEGSLQYVYGTEVRKMEDLEVPGDVHIGPSPQPSQEPTPGVPTQAPVPGPGEPTQAPVPGGPTQAPFPGVPTQAPSPGGPTQTPVPDQPTQAPDTDQDSQGSGSQGGNDNQGNTGQNNTALGTGVATGGGTPQGGQTPQGGGSQGGSSQGSGSQGGSSQGSTGNRQPGGQSTAASSEEPEESPEVSSPTPESSTPEPETESSAGEMEEESSASASAPSEEEVPEETSSKEIDWIFVIAVTAIVLAVGAATAAVIILGRKPKK